MKNARVWMYVGMAGYWTIVAVLCVLCLFACTAHAGDLSLEVGLTRTKYHLRECGIWFQCGPTNETNNSLIGNGYGVDLNWTATPTASRWLPGFRLGYRYLGEFHGRNIATVRDEDADKPRGQCISATGENCLAWYMTDGKVSGTALGPTVAYRFNSHITLEAEMGAFYFRGKNNVQVIRFEGSPDCNGSGACEFQYNHGTGSHLTWYAGYGISYDRIRFSVRFYNNIYEQGPGHGGEPGLTGGRWTVEKMITFKVLEF